MTSSAPIERTSSSWLVLATPVTWAPNALASWTANHPTAPAAPMTRTCWPAWTSPTSRTAWRAANPEMGTTAASSKLRAGRLGRELVLGRAGVLGEGAVAPAEHLVTGLEPGHLAPTASTVPATSMPSTGTLGWRSPRVGTTRRIM